VSVRLETSVDLFNAIKIYLVFNVNGVSLINSKM